MLYAIFQEGVYRQGCFGIFEHKHTAIEHAERIARADVDDYHHYTVVPFTLNKGLHFAFDSIYTIEETPVFTINQKI